MRVPLSITAMIATIFLAVPGNGVCTGLDDTFLNSTVLIKYKVDATHDSFGTGFLLLHLISSSPKQNQYNYAILLVTNKHVLPREHGSRDISMRVSIRREDGTVEAKDVIVPIWGADGKYLKSVGLHPDLKVDVAVVRLNGDDLIRERINLFYEAAQNRKALTTDLLIAKGNLREEAIGIGSLIYLLGYPDGIYDSRNVSPILRIGVIATEPDKDFAFNVGLRARLPDLPSSIRGFLIDANVYPGSSGSIVVECKNIVPGFSSGGITHILGIVSGSIPIDDLGRTQRMGLGIVYSADTIAEVINLVLTGEERKVGQLPPQGP
jgi:hypothetical protein